ncbi:MAG TPA: NUDIX domain-containing protein [Longimicrobiales bacterium]
MKKPSAGLLMYRRRDHVVEVLLVHPGGPYWKNRDEGAWSIPKGEFDEGEDAEAAARREFEEELGVAPVGELIELGAIRQKSGKTVHAWAVEGDFDCATIRSNSFTLEWPPKSGRMQEFPEVDRAQWFTPEVARAKMHTGQGDLVDRLLTRLEAR